MKIENLKFENLSFGFDPKKLVFDNVSFNFPMNETIWIKGDFGSGKSNFLRLVAGLVVPSEGKVIINDQNIHELGINHFSPFLTQIGFGFDGVGLLVNQSLRNNLAIQLRYHKNWSDEQIDNWLNPLMDIFQVRNLQNERPAFVSQSIYKTFLLLRAFVMAPQMIVINNPLTNLDEIHREAFIKIINLFKKEYGLKHVFISSDDEPLLEKITPQKIWIHNGKIFNDTEKQRISA